MTADQKELAQQLAKTGDIMGAQAVILAALGEAWGGRAREQAKGLEGQIKQLNVEFGNVMQTIGGALLPVMTSFTESLKPAIIGVNDWAKAHPELVSQLTLAAAGVAAVMLAVGPLLIALPTLVSSIGLVAAGFTAAAAAAGGAGFLIGGIIPIIAATTLAIGATVAAFISWKLAVASWQSANQGLADITEKLNAKLKEIGKGVERGTDSWESYTDRVRKSAAAHMAQLQELEKTKKSTISLGDEVVKNTKSTDKHTKAIDDNKTAHAHLLIEEIKLAESQKGHAFIVDTLTKNNRNLLDSVEDLAEAQRLIATTMNRDLRPAIETVSAGTGELTDKNEELGDAWRTLGGRSTDTLRRQADEAHDAYQRIANDASSTMEDVKRAWDLYQEKVSKVNDEVSNDTQATTKEIGGFWSNQVSTIVTDFSKGVTDILFHGGNLKEKLVGIFKSIGETIVRTFIEGMVKKVIRALLGGGDGGGGGGGSEDDSLSGAFGKLGENIKGVFASIKDTLGKVVGSVFDSLKSIGGSIGDFFKGIAGQIAGVIGGAGLLAGGLFTGGKAGVGMSIGGGALAGASIGTMILPGIGTAIGAAIGALAGGIASLFGKDTDKLADTEVVQKGWPLIWKFQDAYVRAPLLGSAEAEAAGRWSVLGAGITAWNEMVKVFKRPESRESQRKYIFDFIEAVNADFKSRAANFPDATLPNLSSLPVQPMARGGFGLVNRPTLFLAGESGPEEFSFRRAGRRGGAGVHQENHFHQVVLNDATMDRLMDRMNRKLVRSMA
jgi:hypothetical protein